MNLKRLSLLLLVLLAVLSYGQKKPLQHSDYDGWKNLGRPGITNDAKWVSYEINPQQGDGWLYFNDIKNSKLDSIERGNSSKFSPGSEYFVYLVKPTFAETRMAKKDKKKGDDMPKSMLGIRILSTGQTELIERVKSFQLADEEEPWMAYLMEKPLSKKDEGEEKTEKSGEKEPEAEKAGTRGPRSRPSGKGGSKLEGTELVVLNPADNSKYTFQDVINYKLAKNGSSVAIVQGTTDTTKINNYKVIVFDTDSETSTEIFNGDGTLKNITLSDDGEKFSFIFTGDTSDVKVYDLYLSMGDKAKKVVSIDTPGMPAEWSVSENGTLVFSESGNRLFFGTADKPVEEPEDTLLADEKYSVDIWSWHDPLLQPQQKTQLKTESRRTYQAVYHIKDGHMVQLATKDIPDLRLLLKRDGDNAIATSNLKYQISTSWDYRRLIDYYLVDVLTGERKILFEAYPSTVSFSPSGKYMVYWNIESEEWLARPTAGGKEVSLTAGLNVKFYDELQDTPQDHRPFRISGWVEGEKYVLVPDKYDLWKMDVTGKEKPVLLTNGYGRKNNIRLQYTSLEARAGGGRFRGFGGSQSDKLYIGEKEEIYFTALHTYTKQSGIFSVKVNKPADPLKIDMGDYTYNSITKARDADMLIWQRGTFVDYPELYVSDLKLKNATRISNTNPQQAQYNWGTVELVEWMSFDGQMLQGLLYKPEDFDPSKKYPMIAYFYERSSDGLHRYMRPAPSASTINRTFAVSNGYLIFVPDIPYVEGYPGHSAYNAVVSGTYALLDRFEYVDEKRLGLDGQSWGGYQIAYLITQTDLFTCAFSGAPVSNMTSAYGGIRWGSGQSRMHQYEQGQSRIGGTLWEKPIHYIENSPIFFVPKINTPVLIMHNDADGAVPWYQGIEFFVALRRLSKPAWMLSYNDEAHNLTKRPNRKDLSVRKMQFFDHYLMGAPAPYWMEKGISQLEKGKKDGYELMKK